MKTSINIVIIEDKIKEIIQTIKHALETDWNLDIKDFNNAYDAINYLKQPNISVNLILLDMKIPMNKNDIPKRENGEKVLQQLCQLKSNYIIPAVVITAYPDINNEAVKFGRKYNIYLYLPKSDREFPKKLSEITKEIMQGVTLFRDHYCHMIENTCNRGVPFKGTNSCFLAFSNTGRYAGFMIDLKQIMINEGIAAFDWLDKDKEFDTPSASVFCPFLCDRIFSRNIFIANVTDNNPNVYFEWGFALGTGRKAYALAEDGSLNLPDLLKANLLNLYKDTNIYKEFFFDDYLTDKLYGNLSNIFPSLKDADLKTECLIIIPPDSRHENYISNKLQTFTNNLSKSLLLSKVNCMTDVLKKILDSKRIILDLMSDDLEDKKVKNAQILFLAGFALSRSKKVVILQEKPVSKDILDIKKILRCYNNIDEVKPEIESLIM